MFRRQIAFPVSVDHLWELLTDPSSVTSWFGSSVEWELAPGGALRITDEYGRRVGRVESVTPPHRLRFQWWPESNDGDVTEVTYDLEPTEDGTQLTITEAPRQSERRRHIPERDAPVGAGSVDLTNRASTSTPMGGRSGSTAWTAWDTRLAGVWCIATAPVVVSL